MWNFVFFSAYETASISKFYVLTPYWKSYHGYRRYMQGMLTGLQTATRGGYSMYQIMPQQAFKAEVIFFCKEKDWNPAYHIWYIFIAQNLKKYCFQSSLDYTFPSLSVSSIIL